MEHRLPADINSNPSPTECLDAEPGESPVTAATKLRWYQFRLRTLLLGVLGISVLLAGAVAIWRAVADPMRFNRRFHRAIASADRIVIREGGFNCCGPVDDQRILAEITDPREIAEVSSHVQFVPEVPSADCLCCGYPGIDWYAGQERIALTAMQHGVALRWSGFPADARFTDGSALWLVEWLASHGITDAELGIDRRASREATEAEAREIIGRYAPAGYVDALRRAEAEEETASAAEEDAIRSRHIRAAFQDTTTLYSTLFQVLGCLTMRWDVWYDPEQAEAFDFLTCAPGNELDAAFRTAAKSDNPAERRGAARFVFSQFFMTTEGKTERDVRKWMATLADAAYADPLPENRRLVLARLLEYHELSRIDVLERAVADPDRTVRRRAIEAMASSGNSKAADILRQVAAGKIMPRPAAVAPKYYTRGAGKPLRIRDAEAVEFFDTDQEAAAKAIEELTVRPPAVSD